MKMRMTPNKIIYLKNQITEHIIAKIPITINMNTPSIPAIKVKPKMIVMFSMLFLTRHREPKFVKIFRLYLLCFKILLIECFCKLGDILRWHFKMHLRFLEVRHESFQYPLGLLEPLKF